MKDFTLKKYQELCEAIIGGYAPITVKSYLTKKPDGKFAILRHDVDRNSENALKMASLEHDMGITSTYYFRTIPLVFKLDTIKKIHLMGHEIGYHYEVLDTAKGDYETAIQLFEQELKKFPCEIKTICMHGNPLTPWVNKDLWEKYKFEEYGILGEAYRSIDYSNILYFSDTGRTWSNKYSVKDLVNAQHNVRTTQDLIGTIKENKKSMCIVTHPLRWNDDFIPWYSELVVQSIKNIGKVGIKKFR